MDSLLKEYQAELKRTRKMQYAASDKNDISIYGGMITDLEIAINWMETGRPPHDRRGIYGSTALEPMVLNNISDRSIAGLAKNPFELTEKQIDFNLEKGKEHGFGSQETYAYLRWAKERKQRIAMR